MQVLSRFSVMGLALAMVLGLSAASVRADDAAKTGTVSGKVLDADGKGVKGVKVIAATPPAKAEAGAKREKPTALATAETGEDGSYKLEAVPVGKIRVSASNDSGRGNANVEVTAGQDVKADDIKLAKGRAGGGGAAGGGRKAKGGGEAAPK